MEIATEMVVVEEEEEVEMEAAAGVAVAVVEVLAVGVETDVGEMAAAEDMVEEAGLEATKASEPRSEDRTTGMPCTHNARSAASAREQCTVGERRSRSCPPHPITELTWHHNNVLPSKCLFARVSLMHVSCMYPSCMYPQQSHACIPQQHSRVLDYAFVLLPW